MRFVLSFAALEFMNFRRAEFMSLAKLYNVKFVCANDSTDYWMKPYVVVDVEKQEDIVLIVKRSVLIKYAFHLWCDASSPSELVDCVSKLPNELVDPYLNGDGTFKMIVSSAHKKLNQDEKNPIIESVLNAHKRVDAKVSLKSPDHQLYILLEYTPLNVRLPMSGPGGELKRLFYGRLVGSSSRKEIMNNYRLSDRTYLGNTTMDVRLAGIMANLGLCRPFSMIWDPFLGTGSIVLAASIWGSFGAGSDIDYSLLHGLGMSPKAGQGKRNSEECLRSNYQQYGLESKFLDVLIADAATLHRLLRLHSDGLFDAVLTDPPYGFRERCCRVANEPKERAPSLVSAERLAEITGNSLSERNENEGTETLIPVPHDLPHFPHKEMYPLNESYQNLLDLSVHLLKPGGRLVFWVPVTRSEFSGIGSIPQHPRLRLLAACEQVLNMRVSRYLITMEKLEPSEPDEGSPSDRLLYRDIFSR